MTYRVVCDENVPEETVEHLERAGIDATHVTDEPGAGSRDDLVASHVLRQDALLLTNDDDFLVDDDYPELPVPYYPDNETLAHELAARVEELSSLVPDATDLGRITFLTP